MRIERTPNTHADFQSLTHRLDEELHRRYGAKQAAYDPHNAIAPIKTAIVGYVGDRPMACGCFKEIEPETVEIKRMFVAQAFRRQGWSVVLLRALEAWAVERGYSRAVLETGKGQPEAMALYAKCGYTAIANYGPYIGRDNSLCMEKALIPESSRS